MGRRLILSTMLAATLLSPAAAQAANKTINVGPGKTLNPSNATIDPSDTITWHWAERQSHHIASNPGSLEFWDSGERETGDFVHAFPKSGSFSYVCKLHPDDMKGTITVTGTVAPPPPPPPNVAPTASLTPA